MKTWGVVHLASDKTYRADRICWVDEMIQGLSKGGAALRKTKGVPDDIVSSLQSDNPVSRGTAILKLASGAYFAPELVAPLVNDNTPFMFGTPVLAVANAYMKVALGTKYEGPLEHSVNAIVQEMTDEWGKRTLL